MCFLYSERVLEHHNSLVSSNSEVINVAIKLPIVAPSSYELIHGRKLQVATGDEKVQPDGRSIQQTMSTCGADTVAVEEIVAEGGLQIAGDKIACLDITSEVVVFV